MKKSILLILLWFSAMTFAANCGEAGSDTVDDGTGSTADTSAPGAPSSFTGSPGGSNQINLSWTASTDDSSTQAEIVYEICQSTTSWGCSAFTSNLTTSAGATSYSVTGLSALTEYYFSIRAVDTAGNSSSAVSSAMITTDPEGVVNSPVFSPVAGSYDISVTVNISSTTVGATICTSTYGTLSCNYDGSCAGSSSNLSSIYLTSSSSVSAIACLAGYTPSTVVTAPYQIDKYAPSTAQNPAVSVSGITYSDVTLSWFAATDDTTTQQNLSYQVYYSLSAYSTISAVVATATPFGTAGLNLTTMNVIGLNSGLTYYFYVIVTDDFGKQKLYNTVSATINTLGAVQSPTFSPVSGGYNSTQSVAIIPATPGATSCYTTDNTVPTCDAISICGNGTEYTTPFSISATTTVKAVGCMMSNTPSSPSSAAYTIDTVVPTPGNNGILTLDNVTTTGLTVYYTHGWDDYSNFPSYALYYSNANNISTSAEILANGTLVVASETWISGELYTNSVSGLTPGLYYVNILQTDWVGNQTAYTPVSINLATEKDIKTFDFATADNPGIDAASTGIITGTDINVTVPYGTDVTSLVPSITFWGASVSPAAGVAQDFTIPVTYTVTASDASTQTYTITVTPDTINSQKVITDFRFDIAANPEFSATYIGTKAQMNISVIVPAGFIGTLIPSFTTTGQSVSLNGVTITSGITPVDFSQSVTFTVTAADNSTQDYFVSLIPGHLIADSGQTSCYDVAGNVIACGDVTLPGQDADYISMPAMRNWSGPVQHPVYTSDYTTRDNNNGLIFKTCPEGLSGSDCASGTATGKSRYSNFGGGADQLCDALNSSNNGAGYAGLKSWRLPYIEELWSLYYYDSAANTVDSASFPGSVHRYWTLTKSDYQTSSTYYWNINLNAMTGSTYPETESWSNKVRCVAGNATSVAGNLINSYIHKPFTDNADGTSTDAFNNLMWQNCPDGKSGASCATGFATAHSWSSALNYCANLNLAGRSWRLPSISELRSTWEFPTVNWQGYTNKGLSKLPYKIVMGDTENFWSSTTNIVTPANAYYQNMYDVSSAPKSNISINVRCVSSLP